MPRARPSAGRVASLLGGAVRERVDVASYLFYRYPSADGRLPAVDTAEAILERADRAASSATGIGSTSSRAASCPQSEEYRALRLLRDRFPDDPLVWDPNAAWSVETTIRVGRRLTADAFELQWLEDPCNWLEGMSQARAATGIPFATNMCLIGPDQLAPGIRRAERGRDPRRRPLLGRVPGQPADGRRGRGVQPGRGDAQRPRARDLHRRDGPPGVRDPEPDLRHRQPLPRPGRRHHHRAVGLPRRPVRHCRPARGSGSSWTATRSTSTTATSWTTPRSTSSTTRYRPGWVPALPIF